MGRPTKELSPKIENSKTTSYINSIKFIITNCYFIFSPILYFFFNSLYYMLCILLQIMVLEHF